MTVTAIRMKRDLRSYDVDGKYTVSVTMNHKLRIGEVVFHRNDRTTTDTHHSFRFQDFSDGTWSPSRIKAYKWLYFALNEDYSLNSKWVELEGDEGRIHRQMKKLRDELDEVLRRKDSVYNDASVPQFSADEIILEDEPESITDNDGHNLTWDVLDLATKLKGSYLIFAKSGSQGAGVVTLYTEDEQHYLRAVPTVYIDWLYRECRDIGFKDSEVRHKSAYNGYSGRALETESSSDAYRKSVRMNLVPRKR